MEEAKQEDRLVGILSICVDPSEKLGKSARIYGLGDNGAMYFWEQERGGWTLNSISRVSRESYWPLAKV